MMFNYGHINTSNTPTTTYRDYHYTPWSRVTSQTTEYTPRVTSTTSPKHRDLRNDKPVPINKDKKNDSRGSCRIKSVDIKPLLMIKLFFYDVNLIL